MRTGLPFTSALGVVAALAALTTTVEAASAKGRAAPRIEVVFALDTTGSMSGLIEGAKRKIWSIANAMASADPTPEIRVGLVGYRDRGDQYVTRRFDLTPDLDAIYGYLQSFRADGGGDGPESVNQALSESITRMSWSADPGVYKVLFLVGDAPPHMDYPNDVKYPQTVRRALERGIVVNTIQCGSWAETAQIWQQIARAGEGEFAAIAQDGAMAAIETPLDERLAELNSELADTVVAYGAKDEQRELHRKLESAASAPPATTAARLSFLDKSKVGVVSGRGDLVDAIAGGRVQLEDVDAAELPEPLRRMTPAEREAHVQVQIEKRREVQREISELVEKRDAFVKDELTRREAEGEDDGFDRKVTEIIRAQAARVGIHYE